MTTSIEWTRNDRLYLRLRYGRVVEALVSHAALLAAIAVALVEA